MIKQRADVGPQAGLLRNLRTPVEDGYTASGHDTHTVLGKRSTHSMPHWMYIFHFLVCSACGTTYCWRYIQI